MCEELAALRQAVVAYASRFDAAALTPLQASTVVELATAIESSAYALKALAAARAAESGAWRGSGHRSPADALAASTGTSVAAAKETLATGRKLSEQPELSEAARSGKLSPQKTAVLAEAGEAGRELLETAQGSSLTELRDAVAKAKAAAEPDLEKRRRAVHAKRHLRAWTDAEGVWHLRGQGCPEDGAQVMSVLSPLADARFDQARRSGQREDPAAYRFDALVDLFRHLAAGRVPDVAEPPAGTSTSPTPPGPATHGPRDQEDLDEPGTDANC